MLQPIKKSAHHLDPERGEEAEEEDDTRTHTSLGSCELNWSRSSLQDELLQSVRCVSRESRGCSQTFMHSGVCIFTHNIFAQTTTARGCFEDCKM